MSAVSFGRKDASRRGRARPAGGGARPPRQPGGGSGLGPGCGLGHLPTWAPAKASYLPTGLWPPITLHGLQKGHGTGQEGKGKAQKWETGNPAAPPGKPSPAPCQLTHWASVPSEKWEQTSSLTLPQGCCEGQTRPREEGSAHCLTVRPCAALPPGPGLPGATSRSHGKSAGASRAAASLRTAMHKPRRREGSPGPAAPASCTRCPANGLFQGPVCPGQAPSLSPQCSLLLSGTSRPTPGSAYSNIFQPLNVRQNVYLFQEAPLLAPLSEGHGCFRLPSI